MDVGVLALNAEAERISSVALWAPFQMDCPCSFTCSALSNAARESWYIHTHIPGVRLIELEVGLGMPGVLLRCKLYSGSEIVFVNVSVKPRVCFAISACAQSSTHLIVTIFSLETFLIVWHRFEYATFSSTPLRPVPPVHCSLGAGWSSTQKQKLLGETKHWNLQGGIVETRKGLN